MDKLDYKLLYHLDQNSRAAIDSISSKMKISSETLRYRFNKLESSNSIFKFHSIIDTSRLGFTLFKLYLKLQSASAKVTMRMTEYFKKNSSVVSLIATEGNYDFCIGVLLQNVSELNTFIEDFMKHFHEYVAQRSVCVNIKSDYLTRDYLVQTKRKQVPVRSYQATAHVYRTDKVDVLILCELAKNSRQTALQILTNLQKSLGKDFPLSRETIHYRIRKLEQSNVINGYNLVLNHEEIGQLQYKVLIRLNYFENAEIDSFLETLREEPSLVYIIKTLGEWDYEIEFEVKSIAEYREALMKIMEKHPRMIKDYSTLLLTKIHIYDVSRRIVTQATLSN